MQFQVGQAATDIEAARLLVFNAARLKDAGQPFTKQAAMAKLAASQVAERVASQCIEFFGGIGYVRVSLAAQLGKRHRIMESIAAAGIS